MKTYKWYWGAAPPSAFDDIQENIFRQLRTREGIKIDFVFDDTYKFEEISEILSVCYDCTGENKFMDHAENVYTTTLIGSK